MITYGGIPLLLEDPDHIYQAWLERNLPLDDFRLWGQHLGLSDGRQRPRGVSWNKVGLGTPNWPDPPRIKLNTLWWPTGASRWARGLFLADGDSLAAIEGNLDANGEATLVMQEEGSAYATGLATSMHLLPPRPLNNPSGGLGGWLLPLVDARWWWQYRDVELVVESDSTWADVFAALMAGLGLDSITVSDVPSGYAKPDPVELTRRWENAAGLLDACAASVGMRVTRQLDGTVEVLSATAAADLLERQASGRFEGRTGLEFLAGGFSTRRTLPEKVRVVMPIYEVDCTVHHLEESASTYTADPTVPGTFKTVHTTAPAVITATDMGNTTNSHDLTGLAQRIATDFYAWAVAPYDASAAGILPWKSVGTDDWVWWHFGHQHRAGLPPHPLHTDRCDGDYAAYTRVASLPDGFGVSELAHAFENCPHLGDKAIGVLDAALSFDSSAIVSIWAGEGNDEADTGRNVRAFCWLMASGDTLATGTRVHLVRIGCVWYVHAVRCP